jgi:hypothetical protein
MELLAAARTVLLWLCGLVATAMIGGVVGNQMSPDGMIPGWLTGIAAFTCLRLWLNESKVG